MLPLYTAALDTEGLGAGVGAWGGTGGGGGKAGRATRGGACAQMERGGKTEGGMGRDRGAGQGAKLGGAR